MKFTGERYLPSEEGQIRLEHYHRYALVSSHLFENKSVLDVACGEGYGASLLAKKAKSVIGVDISSDAVKHANQTYKQKNLEFIEASATKLPLPDLSFDVVVSFETIEHLFEQEQMLDEIFRVLKPNGCLIISSPNRAIYSEESSNHNEFHVKELDYFEFDELLKNRFPVVEYYGQKLMIGSVIQHLEDKDGSYKSITDDGSNIYEGAPDFKDPVYFVAVCAKSRQDLIKLDQSVIYPQKKDLIKHYVGFAKWAKAQDMTINELNQRFNSLNEEFISRGKSRQSLEKEIKNLLHSNTKKENQIGFLDQSLNDRDQQIRALLNSNSWRLMTPFRELKRLICNPVAQIIKIYIILMLKVPTRVYQSLPFSCQTKLRHRVFLYKYLPRLMNLAGVSRPPSKLSLPTSKKPLVTIIIPIYGNIDFTMRCLASIEKNPPKVAFEVVVVDDCSPDDSVCILEYFVSGVTLLKNKKNQGFIRSCNAGAKKSKAEYVYFLNNDTQVTAGWLDALLQTFDNFPGTGLVGSKLLYPDGILQEAGGIIWRDGSAWNFGRGQDPNLPVFNYAREVDYCSGASIVIPRKLFKKMRGFDEHYLPAYCEDSDLALRIRTAGYRVIYQPLSTVVHFEGISCGTDTDQGIKAFQIENSKKLFKRWRQHLKMHQLPGVDPENAKDRMVKNRVLVLDNITPEPNKDAGSVTVFNLLLLLRDMGFQVTFIAENNLLYVPEYTTALQRAGVEVLYTPYIDSIEIHLMECGSRYNMAFLFRPNVVERNIKAIRKHCPNAKVLFHTVDLHFLRMQREAKLSNNKTMMIEAVKMKKVEFDAINAADAVIVHSTIEYELLRPEFPNKKISIFPLIINIPGRNRNFKDRHDIIFVGGYRHSPNIDAVQFFASEIMPLLRKQLPGVCFFAAGSNPTTEMKKLECEDVIITGFVEDLDSMLDKMRISVAPLRYGAGIKGKIGSAMAAGLPVVATSIAVEGMSLTDRKNIAVADSAKKIAATITNLYKDEVLWNRISDEGLKFSNQEWGAESAWKNLEDILIGLGFKVQRSVHPLKLFS